MRECVVCGYPNLRPSGHADWCAEVGRLNAVKGPGSGTWEDAAITLRTQRERPLRAEPERIRECGWRLCHVVFRKRNPNQKFCSVKHRKWAAEDRRDAALRGAA